MPELPEVETTKNAILPFKGKTLKRIIVNNAALRWPIDEKLINKIKNVGSICIGKYSAMAVTDYNAGTNHILPTLGSAKFSSGLNVGEFYKKTSYIKLSKKGIEVIGKKAITLAEYEGLIGHAQSIKSRFYTLSMTN